MKAAFCLSTEGSLDCNVLVGNGHHWTVYPVALNWDFLCQKHYTDVITRKELK